VRLESPVWRRQLRCDVALNLARYEGTFSAIDGQKIRCQLAGNGDRSLVAVAPRSFPLIEDGKLWVESWSQMRGLQQHRLQMSIALLGDGHASGVVGRGLLPTAQAGSSVFNCVSSRCGASVLLPEGEAGAA
jgi:hypothetical protein